MLHFTVLVVEWLELLLGTNCRLGRIVAFWNLGRIVAFWNLGRIVAFWNLGRIVAWDELSRYDRTLPIPIALQWVSAKLMVCPSMLPTKDLLHKQL